IPGNLDSHDAPTQAEDVHVVVLDPLADGIMVVAQAGSDPSGLVGGHGRPDAAAADDDPAVDLPGGHGAGQGDDIVRVVGAGIALRGAEVDHGVSRLMQPRDQGLLHVESAVVGGQCDFHRDVSWWLRPNWSFAASTTRSTVKPNSRWRSLSGAEAPKDRMPMLWPFAPTYFAQPKTDACSTETRAVTPGGKTASR